jgi:Ca2+-binding EF-hand superfamily protein
MPLALIFMDYALSRWSASITPPAANFGRQRRAQIGIEPETPMKRWITRWITTTALAAAFLAGGAMAQEDREAYNLRAATADMAVFHQFARDGVLRREDVQGNISFAPRFVDADSDQDGVVTAAEMGRYIQRTYGITSSASEAEDAYRRHAANRDLEAFQQLARGGTVKREDAYAHSYFGPRFDEADVNADGVLTAQEMENYIRQRYGVVAHTATGKPGSASAGSGRR